MTISFDLPPGVAASFAASRRGRAKVLAEFIIRRMGEQCPFKNPPSGISRCWALGITADGEVYMASQSAIGKYHWDTKGKGDPSVEVPEFKHFKFVDTGCVRKEEAYKMLDEEAEKLHADDAKKAKTAKCAKSAHRKK